MIQCLHCDATTSNGLALCDLCQRFAESIFEMLPIYFGNLARWRPGRAGTRPVPGSRVLYTGDQGERGDRISDALDEAHNMLTTYARMLVDDRPHLARLLDRLAAAELSDAKTVAWLCRGFEKFLTSLATLEWCGQFVRDLATHEAKLRGLTETAVPGWYAGSCRQCTLPTFAVPGLTWVTCRACGTTTYARDHLDVILDEARDWVARPREIAKTIVALVDTEQSVPKLYDRIRQWEVRGDLIAVRRLDREGDPVGPKRYELGAVLDILLGDTRATVDGRIGA